LLSRGNNGYGNAPQPYVLRILPLLLLIWLAYWKYKSFARSSILIRRTELHRIVNLVTLRITAMHRIKISIYYTQQNFTESEIPSYYMSQNYRISQISFSLSFLKYSHYRKVSQANAKWDNTQLLSTLNCFAQVISLQWQYKNASQTKINLIIFFVQCYMFSY
jgi:hypothetical protein